MTNEPQRTSSRRSDQSTTAIARKLFGPWAALIGGFQFCLGLWSFTAGQAELPAAAARVAWHAAAPTWDVAHLVFLDETGITNNLLRRYGRAPRGAL